MYKLYIAWYCIEIVYYTLYNYNYQFIYNQLIQTFFLKEMARKKSKYKILKCGNS